MQNYEDQYKKCKSKYLDLKNSHNIEGGFVTVTRLATAFERGKPQDEPKIACDEYFWDFDEEIRGSYHMFRYYYKCITSDGKTHDLKFYSITTDTSSDEKWLNLLYKGITGRLSGHMISKDGKIKDSPSNFILLYRSPTHYNKFMELFEYANEQQPTVFTKDWVPLLQKIYKEDYRISGPYHSKSYSYSEDENKRKAIYIGKGRDAISMDFKIPTCYYDPCFVLDITMMKDGKIVHKLTDEEFIVKKLHLFVRKKKIGTTVDLRKEIDEFLKSNAGVQQRLYQFFQDAVTIFVEEHKLTPEQHELILAEGRKFLNIDQEKKERRRYILRKKS